MMKICLSGHKRFSFKMHFKNSKNNNRIEHTFLIIEHTFYQNLHFLVVVMLCKKFEQILIKIGFFINLKVASKFGQRPCTIVQSISPKMTRREFFIFIIFSDAYTCSYVTLKVLADSNQIWIFYEFLNLLKNRAKDPVL